MNAVVRACALVLAFVAFCSGSFAQSDKNYLDVHFISVGQGDATLIRCSRSDRFMLIDAADTRYPNSAKQFKDYLETVFKGRPKRLDVVVVSHPHADHIGSRSGSSKPSKWGHSWTAATTASRRRRGPT